MPSLITTYSWSCTHDLLSFLKSVSSSRGTRSLIHSFCSTTDIFIFFVQLRLPDQVKMLGTTVDVEGVPNRSGGLQRFVIAILVLTITSTSLRFWSRSLAWHDAKMRDSRLFWWDDWFALTAAVLLLIQLSFELVMIHSAGFGQHLSTLSQEQSKLLFKLLYAGTFFFFTAVSFTKFSVLFFLTRLFPPRANPQWFNYMLWTCYALNIAWLIGIIFATVFLCDLVEKNWDPSLSGTCGTEYNLYLGNSVPSAIIDLAILLLPLPKLWVLQISIRRKLGLAIIFVLGYAVIVVSIGRFIQVALTGDALKNDFTWAAIPLFFWISAEPGISVVCASLPALLPLGRKLAERYPFAHGSQSDPSKQSTGFSAFRRDAYAYDSKNSKDIHLSSRGEHSACPESGLMGYETGNRLVLPQTAMRSTYHA
ncbi:hypothetical protein F4802DRAFT_592000 [Xylaria palmicola]|nr:hypothetical protein F4802DRAFT_592000 [Xylaria palmicola]